MPRLKAFRIVNLLYNNQENIIPDMTMDFRDQSGYVYLENGGGKSVMIQLLCAPFMKGKTDRDFKPNNKPRPFGDFFPTTSPTFLIMQFDKDEGGESFNVGMMGCRATDLKTKDYHLYTFIEEFSDQREHLNEYQVQGTQNKKMTFDAAQKYFRNRERHSNLEFFNVMDSEQNRRYFDRLSDLKISQREWKLIRDICQEESGMSSYREKYREDKDLLFELILPMVEEHINLYLNGEGRMENIQVAFNNYLKNYNQSRKELKEYDTYKNYYNDLEKILQKEEELLEMREELSRTERNLFEFELSLKNCIEDLGKQIQGLEEKRNNLENDKKEVVHEEISFEYHQKCREKAELEDERKSVETKLEEIGRTLKDLERDDAILVCSRCVYDLNRIDKEISKLRTEIAKREMDSNEIQKQVDEKGRAVYSSINQKIRELNASLTEKTEKWEDLKKRLKDLEKTTDSLKDELRDYKADEKSLKAQIRDDRGKEKKLLGNVKLSMFSDTPQIAKNECSKLLDKERKNLDALNKEKNHLSFNQEEFQKEIDNHTKVLNDLRVDEAKLQAELDSNHEKLSEEKQRFEDIIRKSEAQNIKLDENDLFNKESAFKKVQEVIDAYTDRLDANKNLLREDSAELERLESKNPVEIERVVESAAREVCDFTSGYEWLKDQENSVQLAEKYPVIPYSIIVDTVKDRDAVLDSLNSYTRHLTPILTQEEARNIVSGKSRTYDILVGKFDAELIDLEALESKKETLRKSIDDLTQKCKAQSDYIGRLSDIASNIRGIKFSKNDYDDLCNQINDLEKRLQNLKNKKLKSEEAVRNFTRQLNDVKEKLSANVKQLSSTEKMVAVLEELLEVYGSLIEKEAVLQNTCDKIRDCEAQIESYASPKRYFENESEKLDKAIGDVRVSQKTCAEKLGDFKAYENDTPGNSDDISRLTEEYNAMVSKNELIGNIEELKKQLSQNEDDRRNKRLELGDKKKTYSIRDEDIIPMSYEEQKEDLDSLKKKKGEANNKKDQLAKKQNALYKKQGGVDTELGKIQNRLYDEGFENYIPLDEIQHHDFKQVIREINAQIKQTESEHKTLSKKSDSIEKLHFVLKENFKKLPAPEHLYPQISYNDLTEYEIKNKVDDAVELWKHAKDSLDKGLAAFKKHVDNISDSYKEAFAKNLKTLQKEIGPDNIQNLYEGTQTHFQKIDSMLQNLKNVNERDQNYFRQFKETIIDYAKQIDNEIRKIDSYTKVDLGGKKKKLLEIKYPKLNYDDEWMTNRIHDWLFKVIQDVENVNAQPSGKLTEKDIIRKELTGEGILKNIMNPSDIEINVVKVNDSMYRSYRWESMQFSGGEGFAATFAVFIALCAYARSDEFSGRNKNKNSMVIIMDNPFGEAQNQEILAPLMQLMDNVNFQFIAFSAISLPEILELFNCVHRLELVQCTVNGTDKTKNIMMLDGKRCTAMQDRDLHVTKQISMLD